MILTVTDTVQTTGGPMAPLSMPLPEAMLYGFDKSINDMTTIGFDHPLPDSQYVASVMEIQLSAKQRDGSPMRAYLPWDYMVLLANGEDMPAHELQTGDKLAYFTRVMRHEKYAAMRVVPFMKDRVLEHRFVWEQHKGMDVPETHSVDHIDGDSYNNAYTNLRALEIRAHSRMTANRQRNRHTRRNADGSFAKGSTTTRVASADKPIPDFLFTGSLFNTCTVVGMDEVTVQNYAYQYPLPELNSQYIIMGNLVVQPNV